MVFAGFSKPTATVTPDELFDVIMPQIDNLAELKVTMYVVRHTLGYQRAQDWIALSQFETGIVTTKPGRQAEQRRIDAGVGLSRPSIVAGLKAAVADGYLRKQICCPDCGGEVGQSPLPRTRQRNGRTEEYVEMSVPDNCPHCQRRLKARERVYYGLNWAEKGVKKVNPFFGKGVKGFNPFSTEIDPKGVKSFNPQNTITMSFTPADAGEAASASLDIDHTEKNRSDLAAGNDLHRDTPGAAGNGQAVDGEAATSDAVMPNRHSGTEIWTQLQMVLHDEATVGALADLIKETGVCLSLTTAGFRAARLTLSTLPERRRRVLEDLRRMRGRTDLHVREREKRVRAILTLNIGVTLGLGLTADGRVRMNAGKADFGVIGGLIKQYGAEVVWLTACEVAGQRFEGDPIEYLRAVLRNKREREHNAGALASRSFDTVDYLSEQVGIGA